MDNLFLHACCAPCSIFPLKDILTKSPKLSLYLWYYNPNIHPKAEYLRRRDTLAYLISDLSYIAEAVKGNSLREAAKEDIAAAALVQKPDVTLKASPYEPAPFLEKAASFKDPKERCEFCYTLRIGQAASKALSMGFKYFSTTLLFSRQQDHELIRKICRQKACYYGLEFLDEDWRLGHSQALSISKKLNIYRQNYCGCVWGDAGM